jgi:hypothetical protein
MSATYKSVIIIGLRLSELSLINVDDPDCELHEYQLGELESCKLGRPDNIIGFEYTSTEGFDGCAIQLNDSVVNQLKDRFVNITDKVAKVYLATVGY